MKEIDIKGIKNILYSKIDQLSNLIGDNFKTVHYDYFSIEKDNIDEGISKIKEIIKNGKTEELEVLVMRKDIINLTKEFLEKDIIGELEKEKRKLRITRHIYIVLILILLGLGVIVYGGYFKSFFEGFYCPKQNVCKNSIVSNKNITSISQNITGNNIVQLSGDILSVDNITGNNIVQLSGDILSGDNITGNNIAQLSGDILSEDNITGNNIVQLSGDILSGDNITGNNIVQLSGDILSARKVNSITGNFIVGELENNYKFENNILTGTIKVNSVITNDEVKLDTLKTGFDIKDIKYLLIKFDNLKISTGDVLSGSFETTGSLKDNVLLGNLLTGGIVEEKIDENEKKLEGEELIKYQEEKKEKCPYSGIVKVNVFALNLRESNTKYSKRLGTLKKGTELEVLKCQKNLEADSWWYKVKIVKTGDIGWVSTIGIGQ